MKNLFKHWRNIAKHRRLVLKYCTKCGLFFRGLVHDLSKYSPAEFFEGVKYYSSKSSSISNCRKENGYSLGWLHHKAKNKHHLEYWYDNKNEEQMIIPYKYLVEHICDRIAECKAYNKDKFSYTKTLDYFVANRHNLQANEKVLDFIEKILSDLTMKYEHTVLNKNYLKYTYDSIMFEQDSDNIQN